MSPNAKILNFYFKNPWPGQGPLRGLAGPIVGGGANIYIVPDMHLIFLSIFVKFRGF